MTQQLKPTIYLDFDMAVNLMEKAIGEAGEEYVYDPPNKNDETDCVYFHNGQPSCLVGHVFDYLGITADDAERGYIEGKSARDVLPMLGIDADDCAVTLLTRAQEKQDLGRPWGRALREAKEEIEAFR